MVAGESDSIKAYAVKEKSTMHDFNYPYFSKDTKSVLPSAPAKISFFYMMKMFEQTVESDLDDLSNHQVSMKLHQRGMVVTDGLTPLVTLVVTSHDRNVNF